MLVYLDQIWGRMNNIRQHTIHFILVVVATLFLSACLNEIRIPLKTARLQLPEVSERMFAGNVALNQQTGSDVVIVQDADRTPPDDRNTYVTTADGPVTGGDAAVTILPRTEVSLSYARGIYMVGGKAQILGPSREQSAKGDVSLAVSVGYGRAQISDSETGNSLRWKANYDVTILDSSAVLGYRVGRRWLLYGGPFYQSYDVSGKLHQYNLTSSAAIGDFDINNRGRFYGFNFGFEFFLTNSRKFSLITEGSRGTADFKNTYYNETPIDLAVAVRAFF